MAAQGHGKQHQWIQGSAKAEEELRFSQIVGRGHVHSTGIRIEKAKDKEDKEVEDAVFFARPEEFAKLDNGELVFPMTKFNYRMIALTQPK